MIFLSSLFVLLPLVFAYPLQRRAAQICNQFDAVEFGSYVLLANHWGESEATSGHQCSTLESVSDGIVRWHTSWMWTGSNTVKSFTNVQLNAGINRQLSSISGMPTTWDWLQRNTGTAVADVAYDLFTSDTVGGPNANEMMVWLGNFNAGPISYNYDANGKAIPVASNLAIGGYTWNLYLGSNRNNPVYSFLPVDGNIHEFSSDLYQFFRYLLDCNYFDSSQYLVTAQAGTEATSGKAVFQTTAYSLSIN